MLRPTELLEVSKPCIVSISFPHKDIHKVTQHFQGDRARNLTDDFMVHNKCMSNTQEVKACRGADIVVNDHCLRTTIVMMKLKKTQKKQLPL